MVQNTDPHTRTHTHRIRVAHLAGYICVSKATFGSDNRTTSSLTPPSWQTVALPTGSLAAVGMNAVTPLQTAWPERAHLHMWTNANGQGIVRGISSTLGQLSQSPTKYYTAVCWHGKDKREARPKHRLKRAGGEKLDNISTDRHVLYNYHPYDVRFIKRKCRDQYLNLVLSYLLYLTLFIVKLKWCVFIQCCDLSPDCFLLLREANRRSEGIKKVKLIISSNYCSLICTFASPVMSYISVNFLFPAFSTQIVFWMNKVLVCRSQRSCFSNTLLV